MAAPILYIPHEKNPAARNLKEGPITRERMGKVLFIIDASAADPSSGAEMVCHQQAAGLAKAGLEVFVLARTQDPAATGITRVANFVEYRYFAPADRPFRFFYDLLRRPARFFDPENPTSRFDLLIVHQPLGLLSLQLGGRFTRTPILYVFHSPWHMEYSLKYDRKRTGPLSLPSVAIRRQLERIAVKRARKVMTLSRYMAHKLRTVHGLDESRIRVNPGGADLERYRPLEDRRAVKEKLQLPSGSVHLFTLRNLEPRMGLDRLVEAAAALIRRRIPLHLTIGGQGPEQRRLERLVEEANLTERVRFTGFLPESALRDYYGAADFFILPTRKLEGFGLVTPEAMACGTPVLGTPVGGTAEILSLFEPDFLFADASAAAMAAGIESTIGAYPVDGRQYRLLRDRCRQYAENHYSWRRHVKQLSKTIQEMVRFDGT